MIVTIAMETRFDRLPAGTVWSNGALDHSFWQRYLDVFDGVRVVARVRDVQQVPSHARRADGPRVAFAPVPYYVGPWHFVRRYCAVRRAIRVSLQSAEAVILRVPGTIATYAAASLLADGRPYGVEVVGDPRDVFAPGGVRSLLRPIMRRWYPRHLRRQCAAANAVAYVTAGVLQNRYPAAPTAYTTSYSSIELGDEAFVEHPPAAPPVGKPFRMLLIGSLDQLYKAPDVLIEALGINVKQGLDLQLTIVGDGRHRQELESLAVRHGVVERVRFTGRLPAGAAVRQELDNADLFVLPSRTEGLPRALIEAMARGLPCLASNVGGIPELLAPCDLVSPGSVDSLANAINEVAAAPDRRAAMAQRNLDKAREYHADILRERRRRFYCALRDATVQHRPR